GQLAGLAGLVAAESARTSIRRRFLSSTCRRGVDVGGEAVVVLLFLVVRGQRSCRVCGRWVGCWWCSRGGVRCVGGGGWCVRFVRGLALSGDLRVVVRGQRTGCGLRRRGLGGGVVVRGQQLFADGRHCLLLEGLGLGGGFLCLLKVVQQSRRIEFGV